MNYIKKIIKRFFVTLFTFKREINVEEYNDCINYLEKLKKFVNANSKVQKKVVHKKINKVEKLSWVGAQISNDKVYFIPNGESEFLIYDLKSNKFQKIGNLSNKPFKWTGGNIYNNKLYSFPRSSNKLLELNLNTKKIELHDLELNYSNEHHYGGVLTEDGVIYQPPRNNNYILKINLKDYSIAKIYIAPKFLKLRYCGSIKHPNGMIYFLPENGKVLCFNPKTNHISFIGKNVKVMTEIYTAFQRMHLEY